MSTPAKFTEPKMAGLARYDLGGSVCPSAAHGGRSFKPNGIPSGSVTATRLRYRRCGGDAITEEINLVTSGIEGLTRM